MQSSLDFLLLSRSEPGLYPIALERYVTARSQARKYAESWDQFSRLEQPLDAVYDPS
jgi:hypothetical protein